MIYHSFNISANILTINFLLRAVQNTTKIVKMTKCPTKQNQYILGTNESRKLVPLKMTKNQLVCTPKTRFSVHGFQTLH